MAVLKLKRWQLQKAVRFVPALGLIYVNNAKVACTSTKGALWKRSDEVLGCNTFPGRNPHVIEGAPWDGIFDCDKQMLLSAKIFTIVRDPHARLLSVYLSRFRERRSALPPHLEKRRTPGHFSKWYDRHIGDRPTNFPEFVRDIVKVPENARDQHVRPQWINILGPM